jgi:hypothetical protein
MTAFPGPEPPLAEAKTAPDPDDVTLFARIEDLVGEEAALIAIPADRRDRGQRDRLHTITADLDRIFDKLRERARRLADERA